MKKLAVVRGESKRIAQAEFFSIFKRFAVEFLAGSFDQTWRRTFSHQRLGLVELQYQPWFLVDPIKLIQGRTNHRSWIKLWNLETYLRTADVINTHELFCFFSHQAACLARRYRKLMTTVVWTSFPHPAWFIPPYSFNVQKTLAFTDLFLARSQKAAEDYLRFLKVPDSKIKVIYPGVNLKRFYPVKRKTWEKTNILFVGQLVESKGLADLLAVFPRLCREFPELELLVCGQGKLVKEVKEAGRQWPIKYLGQVDYLKIPQVYRLADIFVAPSQDFHLLGIKIWEEFFAYVLLEAMASGLPIVASHCGGTEEEIGRENLLIKQKDKEELFKALRELVADLGRREELGRKNRKRAEKLFDLEKQARKTETAIFKFL